jgi:hypothetical protein
MPKLNETNHPYWSSEPAIVKKGNILVAIGDLVDDGLALLDDLEVAIMVCEHIRQLITMSDNIPNEYKHVMDEDMIIIQNDFKRLKRNMMRREQE